MAIAFSDFSGTYSIREDNPNWVGREPFENAVVEANEWINENSIEVINIETVVINCEKKPATLPQYSGGVNMGSCNQFVRVWYSAK